MPDFVPDDAAPVKYTKYQSWQKDMMACVDRAHGMADEKTFGKEPKNKDSKEYKEWLANKNKALATMSTE